VPSPPARLLLLLPTTTYRIQAFLDAARKLGVEIIAASERPNVFEERAPENLVTLDFNDPARSAETIAELGRIHPIDAVVAVDDLTTIVGAAIAERLGLKANSVAAASAARDKHEMRRRLSAAAVPVPAFRLVTLEADLRAAAARATYPCVLKPLTLSASRGVIRADDEAGFVAAARRIEAILRRDDVAGAGEAARALLVEEFVPGREVAVEGLVIEGTFHTLAIFDKPDPLDGPFFEETLYVTPSRLSAGVQKDIVAVTEAACAALGLVEGPVHAELRVNERGPWVLEVAARSIGGLCSRALRFGTGMTLEELILRRALRWPIDSLERERKPAGVMMIPIPRAGRLQAIQGRETAEAVPGVEEVAITAHLCQDLVPLPEGWQYLGFIFARASTPDDVERALREAHRHLHFDIA
jgi:biotin carboxylase